MPDPRSVKGPNGVVVVVPGQVASGLVGDGSRGYGYADEPSAPPESKKRKPASRKSEPK